MTAWSAKVCEQRDLPRGEGLETCSKRHDHADRRRRPAAAARPARAQAGRGHHRRAFVVGIGEVSSIWILRRLGAPPARQRTGGSAPRMLRHGLQPIGGRAVARSPGSGSPLAAVNPSRTGASQRRAAFSMERRRARSAGRGRAADDLQDSLGRRLLLERLGQLAACAPRPSAPGRRTIRKRAVMLLNSSARASSSSPVRTSIAGPSAPAPMRAGARLQRVDRRRPCAARGTGSRAPRAPRPSEQQHAGPQDRARRAAEGLDAAAARRTRASPAGCTRCVGGQDLPPLEVHARSRPPVRRRGPAAERRPDLREAGEVASSGAPG